MTYNVKELLTACKETENKLYAVRICVTDEDMYYDMETYAINHETEEVILFSESTLCQKCKQHTKE